MKLKISALATCVIASAVSVHAQAWSRTSPSVYLTTISDQVGIGTQTPGAGVKLKVTNKAMFDSIYVQNSNGFFTVRTPSASGYSYVNIAPTAIKIGAATAAPHVDIEQTKIKIDNSTSTHRSMLNYDSLKIVNRAVSPACSTIVTANSITTNTVYVGTTGWAIKAPDYVLKKDYKLMPLGQVKHFIDKNGHLPEVPSAAAMEKSGSVNIVEMNLTLLKKIEELTLHLIEQDRKISDQGREIRALKADLNN